MWLDAKKTSAFDFYQFWINQPDAVVEKYLKMYTFLSLEKIEEVMAQHVKNPGARSAQKVLAQEVTETVHGRADATKAVNASAALFGKGEVTNEGLAALPTVVVNATNGNIVALGSEGFGVSKAEMRRLISAKGIRINGVTVEIDRAVNDADFLKGNAILEKGRSRIVLRR